MRRLFADGRCLLSLLFFELIQFIVIRFSIDCIVRWGSRNSFDGVPRDERAVAQSRISHVINLRVLVYPVSFHYTGYLISLSLFPAHINYGRGRGLFATFYSGIQTNFDYVVIKEFTDIQPFCKNMIYGDYTYVC